MTQDVSGWGRFPRISAQVSRPRNDTELAELLRQTDGPVIARGNGRSYGDSAAQSRATFDMRARSHMIDFDPDTGVLVAEAGVLLGDIITAFLPRGWFLPVTPGTKFVTLGGAIAADVHGKNHRRDGSFGAHLNWIDLMGVDGAVQRLTPDDPLWGWSVGGMGLTGVILRCALRLMPVTSGWIRQDMRPARNLDEAIEVFETAQSQYSVAWFDCLGQGADLGKSLVILGDHAGPEDLPADKRPYDVPVRRKLRVPMNAPGFALSRYSLRVFNALYYWQNARKAGGSLVDWDSYFYPLDALHDWNRIYGRGGFAQYQVVLPLDAARNGLAALMRAIAASGQGSFLAVLKRLGAQDSPFSFPMEGYTLALDFPATPKALELLTRLDAITLDHGGRYYLAKDSRVSAQVFAQADPRGAALAAMRRDVGLTARFASAQSERLML
jgi:FAD/FMN-containing dehydrogenase